MRENQRGNRTYADNASAGTQQGRTKENAVDTGLLQQQEENASPTTLNGPNSEGMVYLDIIPRFAL